MFIDRTFSAGLTDIAACMLILLFTCYYSIGQSADTLLAFESLSKGHEFHRTQKNYDSALFYYTQAANQYESIGLDERVAYAKLRSAFSAHRGNQLELAEQLYQKSLQIYQSIYPTDDLKLSKPHMGLGSLYAVIGNYYSALIHTEKSLELHREFLGEEHLQTAVNYSNMGTAYMNYGEYQNAMIAYQKALPVFLENHGDDHQRISSVYVNMGILYDKKGEADKALEYYHKATEIDKKLYGDTFYLLAYNYYNMAVAYMNLNDAALAKVYYDQTIDLSEQYNLQELHAISFYGLGNIAAKNNNTAQAMDYYQKAIDLFLEYFGGDFPGLNQSYRAMAEVLAKQGAHLRAREYLDQTLDLLHKNFGQHHPFIALTYRQIASLQSSLEQFDEALNSIESGFNALSKSTDPESGTTVDDYSDRYILLDLIREHSSILEARYYKDGGKLSDLELAFTTLEKAIDYIDQVRRGYMLDESKMFLQAEAMTTYEQAINSALVLYDKTNRFQYLSAAFRFIEKSKATLLAEALQGNSLKHINGVPDSILNQETSVKQKIRFTESLIVPGEEAPDSLKNILFQLKRSYDALAEIIAVSYPRYYDLKYHVEVPNIHTIQDNIDPGTAVLAYFLGKHNWFIVALSDNAVANITIDSATINQLDLDAFRKMLVNPDQKWNDSTAYMLYHELVLKPLQKLGAKFHRLIIVPDGALGHVPFGVFLTGLNPGTGGPKPYLIHKYAISYTPSITLLKISQQKNTQVVDYSGFAPVNYSNQHANLAPLVGSMEEVTQASKIFNGETFLKEDATESNMKLLNSTGILHLAMHALVDDQDPMRSRLLFSNQNDTLEDGNLYASEIYNLKLNSNLTVLSACNTGFGKIQRGEGIMNLSRAFQYAGSPNIVMSLWQATDGSTNQIMQHFFLNLKQGLSKDQALRQAKITYLAQADPFQSHPYQWATFVYMGNADPVLFHSSYWIEAILSILFIGLLWWFLKRIKTSKQE